MKNNDNTVRYGLSLALASMSGMAFAVIRIEYHSFIFAIVAWILLMSLSIVILRNHIWQQQDEEARWQTHETAPMDGTSFILYFPLAPLSGTFYYKLDNDMFINGEGAMLPRGTKFIWTHIPTNETY